MPHMIEYKDYSVDLLSLPAASIVALANRGLQRVLGSEVSAKVAAKKKAAEEAKEVFDDASAALAQGEAYSKALESLLSGTIGVRAPRGEPVDPIEAEMHRVAKSRVVTALKAAGIAVPKGEAKVTFDSGESFSLDDLIDRQLARKEDEIRREAARNLKAREKARLEAKAKADAAKATGPVDAEALGL